jgi:tetratricopeptide (TPR) repeat protein
LTLAQALHRAQAKTQKHPRSVGAWQTYAQLEMLQAQTQSRRPLYLAALKSYQTLEQLQPSPSNKLDLAYLDVTLRRPQSALDILSAVNAKNAPKSLMLRGLAYQEQGKKDPAIQSFREFLRRAPHSTLAKSVRGWLQRLEK